MGHVICGGLVRCAQLYPVSWGLPGLAEFFVSPLRTGELHAKGFDSHRLRALNVHKNYFPGV